MRSLLIATTAFAALLVAGAGNASDTQKSSGTHHSHKSECKKEAKAKGLTGDEAKSFVKSCVAEKEGKKDAQAGGEKKPQ